MNIFFIDNHISDLAEDKSDFLFTVKDFLIWSREVNQVFDPHKADAIIIQEKKHTFKNFNYIRDLESDPIIAKYPEKTFTINLDDFATGLLRGLYACLPKYRDNPYLYAVVPYTPNDFLNKFIFNENHPEVDPVNLASWYGNTRSSYIRPMILNLFSSEKGFILKNSISWVKYPHEEQTEYVNLMLHSKFSLCPAGWGPASLRIYESMALGRCPVIISDNFIPPKGPDWNSFALFVPERHIKSLPVILRQHEHLAANMGKNAHDAWEKYFSFPILAQYYADNMLSLIRSSPKATRKVEMARWHSFDLHWKNEWTLLQRSIHKLKTIQKKQLKIIRK